MKALLAALSAVLIASACGGSGLGGPGDAVTEVFDAIQAGDGAKVVSYLSTSALEQMQQQVDAIKADPETAVAQLTLMGIEISAEDIPDLTTTEFAEAVFSSPMISVIMADIEVTVGEVTIDGGSAMVEVITSMMGESKTDTIEVVMEDGAWKVTDLGMDM